MGRWVGFTSPAVSAGAANGVKGAQRSTDLQVELRFVMFVSTQATQAATSATNLSKRLAIDNNGFTIGISLGLSSSVIPGISFSYAGYGINISANSRL